MRWCAIVGPFRGCYRKRRKSAAICFQRDPTKGAKYWTSQPELQKDEVVMISLGSVLRLLLGSDRNEVAFSFWSIPVLLPEGEEVHCYLLSERPHESSSTLDKSTRIAKG
jgi:hypothetical protein